MAKARRCVKVRYVNERIARNAALLESRVQMALHQRKEAPLRPYRCPKCWGWHLTSQNPSQYWIEHPA